MRAAPCCLALGLFGCVAPGEEGRHPASECEPVTAPGVSRLEILTDEAPTLALDDGATLPLLFGGQGAAMTRFRVGVERSGEEPCVPLRVLARSPAGERQLDLDAWLVTERVGALWASEVLVALLPSETLEVEASSGEATVRRVLAVGGGRLAMRVSGPSALSVGGEGRFTVRFEGRAVEPIGIELFSYPEGRLEDPPPAILHPGESEVVVPVRAVDPGEALLRARVGAHESSGLAVEVAGG